MNDLPENTPPQADRTAAGAASDEVETAERSLWQRSWPVLTGTLIALILASGGYWLGASSARWQPQASDASALPVASQAWASLPLASAPLASSATASAANGVFFSGSFNAPAALHALFGETVRKGSSSFARWSEVFLPQTPTFQPWLGSGPMLVSPLATFAIEEGGEARQLLLFQSTPESRPPGSGAEGAIIGAATFRPAGDGWQLVRETRAITAAGAWGQAPSGKPVLMGPSRLGLLFQGSYLTQGESQRYAFVVEQTAQGFLEASPIFDLGRDNSGSCASTGQPCYGYTGELRFGRAVNDGAYVIDLVHRGTRPAAGGGLDTVVEVRQFRYQAGRYAEDLSKQVLKARPVAAPVSSAASASSAGASQAQ